MNITIDKTLPRLSLRANFSWIFAGNVIYAACQWGMLTVLAKLGSPQMVGQFALGLAVTAPVFMFANLQLRGIQATDARQEYRFGHYLGLRLIMTLLALLVIEAVSLISGYNWNMALIVMTLSFSKAFESISDVFYGLLQQHERMDRIAKSMIIKGPLSLVVLGVAVYLTKSVFWGTVGLAISWAAVLICYDIPSSLNVLAIGREIHGSQGRVFLPRWDLQRLARLAWMALPLGATMMLVSLDTNIPRYFLERYAGERDLGLFAALAYLMVAGTIVVSALGQSASPRLAKYYATGNREAFGKLLFQLVGIGTLIGVAGMVTALVAGRQILELLYRPEYAQHANVLVLVALDAGISFIASFLGYAMTAARYFRIQLPLFALVIGSTILASIWLIPLWGLIGAALAMTIATGVQAVGSLAIAAHAMRALSIRYHKDK